MKTKEQLSYYNSEYYEKNKERIKKNNKNYYERNKEAYVKRTSAYARQKKYNLSIEEIKSLFDQQQGMCAICSSALNFENRHTHVDHCHTTGLVRGILCSPCNHGLGRFKDNIDVLKQAIKYLEIYEKDKTQLVAACG